MGNTDKILNHIIEIKEDLAGIKKHLENLNSKVATNVEKIEENQKKIELIKGKVFKYGVIGIVIWGGVTFIANFTKILQVLIR